MASASLSVQILVLLAAYLIGSVSFGVVVSKLMGLADPHTYGSGNPGATNVLRTGNKKAALFTLLGDVGKGVLAVLLALNPLHGLAVLATWLAVAFLTRYSSLAAITAAFMAPIYWQLFYGIDARALVILFIAALLVWRHRENINRLLKGKESKIGGNKAPKPPKVKYPPPRVGGH